MQAAMALSLIKKINSRLPFKIIILSGRCLISPPAGLGLARGSPQQRILGHKWPLRQPAHWLTFISMGSQFNLITQLPAQLVMQDKMV